MKTPCKPPHRRGSMPACCIAAAMLLASSSPASAIETNSTEPPQRPPPPPQPPFLNRYTPTTDVDDIAALDLDQRSIVAKLASGTFEGMKEAGLIYVEGRPVVDEGGIVVSAPLFEGRTTVQSLSTNVEDAIDLADSATLRLFETYYGSTDYADRWIRASIDGAETTFENGNADFSKFGLEGRAESFRYGTAVLNIWMSIVGRLETAAHLCTIAVFASTDASVMEWDRAVALYTGSLSRDTGAEGQFPYTLADIQCRTFGTCDPDPDPDPSDPDYPIVLSPLNQRIFELFVFGKERLESNDCDGARDDAEDLRSLMTVPLIQGVLHASYATDVEYDVQETTHGAGAAFAAALLPLIHECNEGNADIVHGDLSPGEIMGGSYDVVKAALERSYECLNVRCEDVGGIMNLRGDGYVVGAEACGGVTPMVSDVDYDDQVADELGDEIEEPEPPPPIDEFDDEGDDGDDWIGYSPPPPEDWEPPQPEVIEEPEPEQSSESGDGGGGGDNMNVLNAALLSGLAFGILGFFGGAAITAACMIRKRKKREESAVEFVTSDEAYGGVDDDDIAKGKKEESAVEFSYGGVDEDDII